MLTEGITWVMTGIGIGMALGSFAAGWVVDVLGAQSGFLVSVAAGTIALAIVLAGQRSLAVPDCDTSACDAAAVPAE
jgi:MFS family permease